MFREDEAGTRPWRETSLRDAGVRGRDWAETGQREGHADATTFAAKPIPDVAARENLPIQRVARRCSTNKVGKCPPILASLTCTKTCQTRRLLVHILISERARTGCTHRLLEILRLPSCHWLRGYNSGTGRQSRAGQGLHLPASPPPETLQTIHPLFHYL